MRKYTFSRWFKHCLAYNRCAYSLDYWSPRYLLHDLDKPLLNLFKSNEFVKNYHRTHSKHHIEYKGLPNFIDMVIDWECSRFTKSDAQMNAVETYKKLYYHSNYSDKIWNAIVKLHLD